MSDHKNRSQEPSWGVELLRRYEYLLIYIAIVVTLTLIAALLDG